MRSSPQRGNKRIDKIISFINSNYTRSLKLDEIAEMANMNSSAFCRFFKDATEKTFLQYVADMRIGYACKLLTIGDMEVSQIAGGVRVRLYSALQPHLQATDGTDTDGSTGTR